MKLLLASAALLVALPSSLTGSLLKNETEEFNYYSESCSDSNITISFSNSTIDNIGTKFIDSPILRCVDLKMSGIRSVQEGAFDNVPNLEYLNLQGNNIAIKDLFSFGSHAKLKQLILSNQKYCCDTTNINAQYPKLEYLDLKGNGINAFSTAWPRPFSVLTYFDLSDNKIEFLDVNSLFPNSLQTLHIHGNRLSSLDLNNFVELRTLTVDNNLIQVMSANSQGSNWSRGLIVSNLRNLNYLSATRNNIFSISQDTFKDNVNLEYLNVSSNRLSTTDEGTFDALRSLQCLVLDNNLFTAIPSMKRNMDIRVLSMNDNLIESLRADDYRYLSKLEKLFLSGNVIYSISGNTFGNLRSLEELRLNKNQLSYLPPGWMESMESLRYLDLSENKFTSLESMSFSTNIDLNIIHLEVNPLKSIHASALRAMPKNATIYMYRN